MSDEDEAVDRPNKLNVFEITPVDVFEVHHMDKDLKNNKEIAQNEDRINESINLYNQTLVKNLFKFLVSYKIQCKNEFAKERISINFYTNKTQIKCLNALIENKRIQTDLRYKCFEAISFHREKLYTKSLQAFKQMLSDKEDLEILHGEASLINEK